jgi:hypothetical protein
LFSLVRRIDEDQDMEGTLADRLSMLLNRNYSDLRPGSSNAAVEQYKSKHDLKVNVVLNILETLTSSICTQRPKPRFITADGNWKQKRRAQRLDKFIEGIFAKCNVYREMTRAFRDAAWTGTGWIKVCPDPDKAAEILAERVFPLEVKIDQRACVQGQAPRAIYQVTYVPVEVLAARYPDHEQSIADAAAARSEYSEGRVVDTDLVKLIEAWHLPSSEKADDGRHALCVDGIDLEVNEWKHDFWPFVPFRWTDIPIGFLGMGLVEQQQPLQTELNKIAKRIQDAMHLLATAWVVCPKGAVKKSHLQNRPAVIVETEPGMEDAIKVVTPQALNNQAFEWVDWLYGKNHETSGMSQAMASGTKPSGVRAAAALRELRDEQTQRYGNLVRSWENFGLDISDLSERTAEAMYDETDSATDFEVRYVGKHHYQAIKWSEVRMDRDSYVLQLWPSNLLPSTPAGKLATTEELLASGLIDVRTAASLLDFPDVERNQSLVNSTIDMVDWAVDKIFDGSDTPVPPPAGVTDLPTAVQRLGYHYLRAQVDGAPEEMLSELEQYITETLELVAEVDKARQAMQMMQQAQAQPPTEEEPGIAEMEAPAA